jgi:hypothetical protein
VRPLTRRAGLILAIAGAVVALPAAASSAFAAPSAPAAPAANSTTYQDSSGENAAAPDITTLTTSNTDAGMLSFRVNVPNRPTFASDMLIVLFVDADNNASTGDPDPLGQGVDYVIEVFGGEAALFRWDGTNFTRRAGDPPATSLIFSYQGGITINISAAELGNTRALKFSVIVFSGITIDPTTNDLDFTNSVGDIAPAAGAGLYPYQVVIARPTLVVRQVSAGKPTAGKPFTLRMRTARSDTGATVQNGRVSCLGRAGNARLRATVQRVVGGWATCTWNLPPNSKGKRFRGSVSIVFEGLRAAESFSGRIG